MDNYVAELLDVCKLPLAEINNKFKIIQVGTSIVYVSNYIKLIDYGDSRVVLKVKNNTLEIVGENLMLSLINKNEIIISGVISSLSVGVKNDKKN